MGQPCAPPRSALVVRNLLGLDKVISLGEVESTKGPEGWRAVLARPQAVDPELGILQAYQAADPASRAL